MSVEYSAIAAKLRAMHSRFLSEKEYDELLSKKSVNDVCAYLKSTEGYSDVLADVDERNIHRGVMEMILEQDILDEYIRLYNFVDKKKRDFMEYWFLGREIDFLKREIRYIYTHEERSSDEVNQGRFNAFFETHTKIKRDVMLCARSLSDCIEACADTPYAAILQRAENLGADLFSIGMLLDSYRYSFTWKAAHKNLDSGQIKLFEKLIGTKTDMLNLMWIYRCKKYYNIEKEIIFTYILPIRHRLSEDVLRKLVYSENAEQFVGLVKSLTVYGELFDGLDKGRFPEENHRRLYNELSKRVFVNHTESLAAIYAYFTLKRIELNNITNITEGIRYNLNTEAIRAHIGI